MGDDNDLHVRTDRRDHWRKLCCSHGDQLTGTLHPSNRMKEKATGDKSAAAFLD